MFPTDSLGSPLPSNFVVSVITIGVLTLNDCPPVTFFGELFHSKIPYELSLVSNQLVPSAGLSFGSSAVGVKTPTSISARVT